MSRQFHEDYLFKSIIEDNISKEKLFNIDIDNEFLQFYNYKNALLNKYENFTFEDFKGSKVINNDYGEVLQITTEEPINFNLKDNDYRNNLKSNLKLVPGIGVKKEICLKSNGYNSLEDLSNHDRYCDKASAVLDNIDNLTSPNLIDFIKSNRYGKDCNLNLLKSASLFDKGDFKFMDIETLGLSNVPIILIGVAEIVNNKIRSTQYLVRDIVEEAAALNCFISHLDEDSAHVTFNGKFFDIPYIRNRLRNFRISDFKLDIPHFDLLYYARYLWGDKLLNCQLQTIEKDIFGIERCGDVPGQYIPGYYDTYLKEGNLGPLIPIVDHNRQDIVSLASFLMKMYEEVNG